MKIDWEEHFTILLIGVITIVGIAVVGGIIYGALVKPILFASIVGSLSVFYFVGWTHVAIGQAIDEWKRKNSDKSDEKEPPYKSKMTNSTLALLDELEAKYKMSTLTFMQLIEIKDQPVDTQDYVVFQQNWDNILGRISTIDTITWIGLINSMPEILGAEKQTHEKA